LIYADAHLHTNPVSGLGAQKIAREFSKRGGWFMAIVSLPPYHYGLSPTFEGRLKSFELLLAECKAALNEGIRVSCLAGFHPAEVERLVKKGGMDLRRAVELGQRVIDHIAKLIDQGLINGVGEVGRPHYKTEPEYVVAAQLIMDYALEVARERGAVVHLHLEEGGFVTVLDISRRISRLKLDPRKVVLHHSRPRNLVHAIEMKLTASVPGIQPIQKYVVDRKIPPRFVFESDYLDDPSRPGSVIYPWRMAEIEDEMLRSGLYSEEYLWRINVDNIVSIYGVEPPL